MVLWLPAGTMNDGFYIQFFIVSLIWPKRNRSLCFCFQYFDTEYRQQQILMSKSKLEEGTLYDDQEWGKVRTSIVKQYIEGQRANFVSDQQLIQEQNDLMEEIKQKIKRSRMKDSISNLEVLPIDSSISNISSHYNFADDESLIKNKFTEEFESSMVNSALKEVKSSCSDETYETVRNYVLNNKQQQCENLVKSLEKKSKEIEELSLAVIMKQNQLSKLKEDISPYIAKADFLDDEKKKWRRKNDQLMEKQTLLHKMEKALIFKEKMHQEAKKRGEKLKQFTNGIYSKLKQIENDLNTIRRDIEVQMAKAEQIKCCPEGGQQICWKKEIMKKFRQKLLQERNILKEEEKHLEKRYQILETVSEQCKMLVSQSYEGLVSAGGSGGSALTINSKEDRAERPTSMSLITGLDRRNI